MIISVRLSFSFPFISCVTGSKVALIIGDLCPSVSERDEVTKLYKTISGNIALIFQYSYSE
jgi:hypothetical protein